MANSNNMCRLCLSANGITEPLCYDQRDQFLLQKIYECTTLQIAPLNGIPSSLCTICKARLDEFYQFRWQCIKNDEIIRRIADNFHKQQSAVDPPPPTTSTSPIDPNPKQEVIETGPVVVQQQPHPPQEIVNSNGSAAAVEGGLEISSVHSGYNPGQERTREVERDVYRHPEHHHHVASYGVDHHGGQQQQQYGMPPEFPPEIKYHQGHPTPTSAPPPPHSFEFADFRRKRGRPPKQKYDQYHPHHPIVKYGESSTDDSKEGSASASGSSTATTGLAMEEPETMLSYGEGSSRVGGEYQPYGTWGPPQTKIKLEHMEQQQQQRYDGQISPGEVPPDHDGKPLTPSMFSTSTTQTLLTPDGGFVKRSRGRPPREGGCPNQDRTEYRFQCQYCEARFKAAINLKLHTNTHTGERPYKCQLCDKSFAHPSNLSVHTKLHTQERVKREGQPPTPSEKKFQCPYCHTLFALAFQLKIHINTHTGQKPYVCKNCGKGFAQPSNLHVHIKKHCHKRTDFDGQRTHLPLLQHQPEPEPSRNYQQVPMPQQQQLTIVPIPPPQAISPEEGQPSVLEQQQHHSTSTTTPPPPPPPEQSHPIGMPHPVMMT